MLVVTWVAFSWDIINSVTVAMSRIRAEQACCCHSLVPQPLVVVAHTQFTVNFHAVCSLLKHFVAY